MGCRFAYTKLMSKREVGKDATGMITKTYSIKQSASLYGIDVIERSDLNGRGFLSLIKQHNPDLFISVASPIIFKEALITIPTMGCINIHNAPLPKYRGMLPNFWQMYHDEKAIGITIHEINPKIDEGRILLQKDVDILPNETLDSLIKRTKRMGAHFMIEAINMIKSGSVKYSENDPAKGSYFSFPTREDVKEFKRKGKRIM
jgi:methionyl-tRNA formyltransferase